jgi:hypothetical protein
LSDYGENLVYNDIDAPIMFIAGFENFIKRKERSSTRELGDQFEEFD